MGVAYNITFGVSGLGDPVEQVHLESGRTGPVDHLHKIANLVILIGRLYISIMSMELMYRPFITIIPWGVASLALTVIMRKAKGRSHWLRPLL